MVAERTELLEEARRSEKQHNTDIEQFQNEMEHEIERWKRMISEKEQVIHHSHISVVYMLMQASTE